MKKLRVLALMHEDLVPPESVAGILAKDIDPWRTEWDVCSTLEKRGHTVLKLGVRDELLPVREAIKGFEPDIAFNLLEEFHGEAIYDQNVVAYLELMRLKYSGCNPLGLVLTRDKALSKKILHYHRIKTPDWFVIPIGRKVKRPKRLDFPLIVKSLIEEASLGISKASVVDNEKKLRDRVEFIHEKIQTDAIVETFVRGREFYVGLLGNRRIQVLPTWELTFKKAPDDNDLIATAKVKFDRSYQKKLGVWTGPAKLPDDLEARIGRISKRIYRALNMSGYGRLDYRFDEHGNLYLLDANPNPQISEKEDFALSAKKSGIPYPRLLERILRIGLRGARQI
ncbi:MAG: D-alanine--D-alanine ligase [Myxococcota bacterium]